MSGKNEDLWKVFAEAAPYLSNLWWMRQVLTKLESETGDMEEISRKLEEMMNNVDDVTKKTDILIFLNYVHRKGKPDLL